MKIKFLSLFNLSVIFFISVAWVITATEIEPFLHYHNQQIGFSIGLSFFKSFTNYPGGIADYLAIFLSQFFYYNIFGSFLIVFIASLQGFMAIDIVKRLHGSTKFEFLVFALFLIIGVVVLCDYRYPYYASIRIFITIFFIWFFSILNSKYPIYSIFTWFLLAFLLFYLVSGAALIIFAISTSIIIILHKKQSKRLITVPLMIIFALALPFFSFKFLFPTTLENLYRLTEVKPPEMLAYNTLYQLYSYYLLFPFILIVSFLLKNNYTKSTEQESAKRKSKKKIPFYRKSWFALTLQVIFSFIVASVLFMKSYDPFRKNLIYIEYYSQNKKWNEILEVAETFKVYDFRVNYQVNRAYAHLGQLPDRLFAYPQVLGSYGLFLDNSTMNGSFTMPISDLYYDLGFMSESLRWAFEAQTLLPNSPRILKRIIMIHLVNEKYELAEEFLRVLNRNPLQRKWVSKYEKYIKDPRIAANDPEIAEKRKFSPLVNKINFNPDENLQLLLQTNKDNRLAYDYLMALKILDLNYEGFISYISDYSYYNIKTLPVSWAEMLSFYIIKNKEVPGFVTPELVSRETIDKLTAFNKVMVQYKNDQNAAKNVLRRNYENTFWYYLVYLNPGVTNVLNNKAPF